MHPLTKYAKEHFHIFEPIQRGFAISCITVIFKGHNMWIVDFDLDGTSREYIHIRPKDGEEMIKNMITDCGWDKVHRQLRRKHEFKHLQATEGKQEGGGQ